MEETTALAPTTIEAAPQHQQEMKHQQQLQHQQQLYHKQHLGTNNNNHNTITFN